MSSVQEMNAAVDAYVEMNRANERLMALLGRRYGCPVVDLRALAFLGGAESVAAKRLGAEFSLTTGAVTVLIDRLERRQWATRVSNPADRRSTIVELLPAGGVVLGELRELYATTLQELGASLSLTEIRRMLTETTAALDRAGELLSPRPAG